MMLRFVLACFFAAVVANHACAREVTLDCRDSFNDSNNVRRYGPPYLLKIDLERSFVTEIDYTGKIEYRVHAAITPEFIEWRAYGTGARHVLNRITGTTHCFCGTSWDGRCEVKQPIIK
jgi:hypothetical protein